jgi:hypothetical protein
MNIRFIILSSCLFSVLLLNSCGPSQADLNALSTQIAANIYATLTAQAPTSTPTFTPTSTPTNTLTPTPTRTPTITPTPTPDLSAVALTIGDLPAGFAEMPAEQLHTMERSYPEGSVAFGFLDEKKGYYVAGVIIPFYNRMSQLAFDESIPATIQVTASILGVSGKEEELLNLEEIGDARGGASLVSAVMGQSLKIDIVVFRRDATGVVLFVMYIQGDEPPVQIDELAQIIDDRILKVFPQ